MSYIRHKIQHNKINNLGVIFRNAKSHFSRWKILRRCNTIIFHHAKRRFADMKAL